jgi:hypothetical protein
MQADLHREKKTMTRLWAKRETQIQGVVESTLGMIGDLQGIVGTALQDLEAQEVPLLEGATKVDEDPSQNTLAVSGGDQVPLANPSTHSVIDHTLECALGSPPGEVKS